VPVAAPSANISGRKPPTRPEEVLEQLDGTPAIVCRLIKMLRSHLEEVRGLHASDLAAGLGKVVGNRGATTSMARSFKKRFAGPWWPLGWQSRRAATPSDTRSGSATLAYGQVGPPTCWSEGQTSAPSRNCSATVTFASQ